MPNFTSEQLDHQVLFDSITNEQKLEALFVRYCELKADVRNYDNLLWQLPVVTLGFLTVTASVTKFDELSSMTIAIITTPLSLSLFTIWYFVTRQESYRQFTLTVANEIEVQLGASRVGYPSSHEISDSLGWWKKASSVSVIKFLFFMIFFGLFILSIVSSVYTLNIYLIILIFFIHFLFFSFFSFSILSNKEK